MAFRNRRRSPLRMQWEKFSVAQSIPNDVAFPYTNVTGWESAADYGDELLVNAFNPATGVFTVPAAGAYIFSLNCNWAANAVGYRKVTDAIFGDDHDVPSIGATVMRMHAGGRTFDAGPGTFVPIGFAGSLCRVKQNSGGALDLTFAAVILDFFPR